MKTKIINDKHILNSIELKLSTMSEYRFEDNGARKAINELGFGLGCLYYFYSTTLNPEADKALAENYYKNFEDNIVRFNASMMKVLLEVIHDGSKEAGIAHVYFPLVRNVEVHYVDVHTEQVYWPVVHILKDATSDQQADFEKSAEWILENDWNEIKKREAPFNYNMEKFQPLKDRQIKPLLVEQGVVFTGDQLKKAADWLLQYQYIYESQRTGSIWDD